MVPLWDSSAQVSDALINADQVIVVLQQVSVVQVSSVPQQVSQHVLLHFVPVQLDVATLSTQAFVSTELMIFHSYVTGVMWFPIPFDYDYSAVF